MRDYTLAHLSDSVLLRELSTLVAQDRATTARLLAHLAEVDARRLYAPAGYSSLFTYCVAELRFSEDAAYKRIQAARAARQFPTLFEAVAEGRLHLTAVGLLAPHLTAENAATLIEAATHRTKPEIEAWLGQHFGGPPSVPSVSSITVLPQPRSQGSSSREGELALEQVGREGVSPETARPAEALDGHGRKLALEQVAKAETPPPRFLLKFTIDQATHDELRHAQALLSHTIPSGDLGLLLRRALRALIAQVEKQRIGKGSLRRRRPRSSEVSPTLSNGARCRVPARIRRAVWERDRGQCTFVGAGGRRCGEHRFLEFDHVEPVARGGTATVEGIRLRCRPHNQLEAERVFGTGFMNRKRQEARDAAAETRAAKARSATESRAAAEARAGAAEQDRDVYAGLRSLGCRADEARRAVEFSRHRSGNIALEERMKSALLFISRRAGRMPQTPTCSSASWASR